MEKEIIEKMRKYVALVKKIKGNRHAIEDMNDFLQETEDVFWEIDKLLIEADAMK
jgi:hypothetical protein